MSPNVLHSPGPERADSHKISLRAEKKNKISIKLMILKRYFSNVNEVLMLDSKAPTHAAPLIRTSSTRARPSQPPTRCGARRNKKGTLNAITFYSITRVGVAQREISSPLLSTLIYRKQFFLVFALRPMLARLGTQVKKKEKLRQSPTPPPPKSVEP